MNKSELKKLILEQGIKKQEQIVNDFKQRIAELQGSEKLINETQYDRQQASFNGEANEQIDLLVGQLAFVEEEMELLQRLNIDAPLHDSVHFGSVVETDLMTFYICVSLEEFEAGGKKYFGISTKAPLYREMLGKKIGDKFEFNKKTYLIKDIY
jgi:transcription elongation GreA/GreB family factor